MKLSQYLPTTLFLSIWCCHATQCKRDSCYKAVAVQISDSPDVTTRKADCSSVLRVQIENIQTVTRIATRSGSTSTETVTRTTTSLNRGNVGRRDLSDYSGLRDGIELEERDLYVARGAVPSYARACRSFQAYAQACLCFGIKAKKYIVPLSTITETRAEVTKTSTVSVTETDACKRPLSCGDVNDGGDCRDFGPLCPCMKTDRGNVCNTISQDCGGTTCSTTLECPLNQLCVLDTYTCCGGGRCQMQGCSK